MAEKFLAAGAQVAPAFLNLDGSVDIKFKFTYNYVTNILKKYVQYCSESEPQTKIAYTASRRR